MLHQWHTTIPLIDRYYGLGVGEKTVEAARHPTPSPNRPLYRLGAKLRVAVGRTVIACLFASVVLAVHTAGNSEGLGWRLLQAAAALLALSWSVGALIAVFNTTDVPPTVERSVAATIAARLKPISQTCGSYPGRFALVAYLAQQRGLSLSAETSKIARTARWTPQAVNTPQELWVLDREDEAISAALSHVWDKHPENLQVKAFIDFPELIPQVLQPLVGSITDPVTDSLTVDVACSIAESYHLLHVDDSFTFSDLLAEASLVVSS